MAGRANKVNEEFDEMEERTTILRQFSVFVRRLEVGLGKLVSNSHFQFYLVLIILWLFLYATGRYSMAKFTVTLIFAIMSEVYLEFYFPNTNFVNQKIQNVTSITIKVLSTLFHIYLILTNYGSYSQTLNQSTISFNTPDAQRYVDLFRSKLR